MENKNVQSQSLCYSLFPYSVTVSQVENYEDVFKVTYSPESRKSEIYICAKGTTPGGRSGLKNEQRIQPKAKYLNFVNSMKESGKKAVFLSKSISLYIE